MPKRDLLLSDLKAENGVGVLLAVQMGGTPNELQLMVQTGQIDREKQGIRPRRQFTVRAIGVEEHRLSLGLFGALFFADEHPILFHHNLPRAAIHFTGKPADVHELVLDIHQAWVSTFGPWRELIADINHHAPLTTLLQSGAGQLGVMPVPAAERMGRVLAHHGLQTRLEPLERYTDSDEHGRSRLYKLLGIDDSYIIALDYTVEEMGKV
jgi:hypothetical protein